MKVGIFLAVHLHTPLIVSPRHSSRVHRCILMPEFCAAARCYLISMRIAHRSKHYKYPKRGGKIQGKEGSERRKLLAGKVEPMKWSKLFKPWPILGIK